LKSPYHSPNDSCCREAGHTTPRMGSSNESVNDIDLGAINGTRLETMEIDASDAVESSTLDTQIVRGVVVPMRTRRVGTLRQALQNSNDASCSSIVDVYQHSFRTPHAWFKATTNASRQQLTPAAGHRGTK